MKCAIPYSLDPGTYVVSENANASYAQSFSGACDSSGNVTLSAGADMTCTIINDDIAPVIVPPVVTPPVIVTPGVVPPSVTTPTLPDTGFAPEEGSTSWDLFISAATFLMVLIFGALFLRKRTV